MGREQLVQTSRKERKMTQETGMMPVTLEQIADAVDALANLTTSETVHQLVIGRELTGINAF